MSACQLTSLAAREVAHVGQGEITWVANFSRDWLVMGASVF